MYHRKFIKYVWKITNCLVWLLWRFYVWREQKYAFKSTFQQSPYYKDNKSSLIFRIIFPKVSRVLKVYDYYIGREQGAKGRCSSSDKNA